jgi:hypothetical protein
MKRLLILFSIFGIALTSCEDKRLQTYMANVPLYLSYDALRSSFKVSNGIALEKPGKIYFYDSYMFINEYQKGIHVVDLSNPANPDIKAFIEVPGNVDMAIRNNLLYADSYVDLLVIDISSPEQAVLTRRIENLFEYIIPPYDYNFPLDEINQDEGVVTGFELKKITREYHDYPYPWPVFWGYRMESSFADAGMPGASSNTYGVGGSMARFITYDDYLYTLESSWKLKSINITNTDNLHVENELALWGNVETVFIAEDYLYVGTSNGMHILDLVNPSSPKLLSTYQHVTACDPVVVEGERAYVTLRAGNTCGGTQDLLEVIDISDKYNPRLLSSFSMNEPYGLGIDQGTLFICEAEFGLKVYDASFEQSITSHLIAAFPGINAFDVIPLEDFLFMIGEDGFYIYDYSDLNNITIIGSLLISPSE